MSGVDDSGKTATLSVPCNSWPRPDNLFLEKTNPTPNILSTDSLVKQCPRMRLEGVTSSRCLQEASRVYAVLQLVWEISTGHALKVVLRLLVACFPSCFWAEVPAVTQVHALLPRYYS